VYWGWSVFPKRFYVIKGNDDVEVTVGKGEMVKYAGITPPSKRGKKAEAKTELDESFAEEGKPEAPAEGKDPDLGFLDE